MRVRYTAEFLRTYQEPDRMLPDQKVQTHTTWHSFQVTRSTMGGPWYSTRVTAVDVALVEWDGSWDGEFHTAGLRWTKDKETLTMDRGAIIKACHHGSETARQAREEGHWEEGPVNSQAVAALLDEPWAVQPPEPEGT